MNKFIFTTISLILFSVSLTSKDFSSERGMTNILGNETWERCSAEMNKQGSQVYELSYERSSTMPKSPFAGKYEPKYLPSIGLPGSIQIYNMEVLNELSLIHI